MGNEVRYVAPDFKKPALAKAPVARTAKVERDGVLPDGFFATTNLPTYVKGADGEWTMPREPRMDGVLVKDPAGGWWVRWVWKRARRAVGIRPAGVECSVVVIACSPSAPRGRRSRPAWLRESCRRRRSAPVR